MMKNTQQSSEDIEAMRHSLAHIFAAALQQLHPQAQFGVGPVIDNGFYYDVSLKEAISEKDFLKIEKTMRKIIQANLPMERHDWPIEKAITYFSEKN
jgi:threonyl-tRNA synthetase